MEGKKIFTHMPVQDGPPIPWEMIAPFEDQAQRNHGQSLHRLAERGGLSAGEALSIVHARPWSTEWEDPVAKLEAWIETQAASQGMDYAIGSTKWPGLSKLMEESGEVLQVVGKIIGANGQRKHWDGRDLVVSLEEELADLYAAMHFVIVQNRLDTHKINYRTVEKLERFRRWHEARTRPPKEPDGSR